MGSPRPWDIAYRLGRNLYLNLTNRCPTACSFCFKRPWGWRFHEWDLRVRGGEPAAERVWREVLRSAAEKPFRGLVYCGYGECTYRLPLLVELGRRARASLPGTRIRLNTIGLGSLIWGRDIAPDLAGCLDEVAVSLNTADPGQWLRLHAPRPAFRAKGFEAVLGFIRSCAAAGLRTEATAVEQPGVDLAAVKRLARSLGAGFRLRPWVGRPG